MSETQARVKNLPPRKPGEMPRTDAELDGLLATWYKKVDAAIATAIRKGIQADSNPVVSAERMIRALDEEFRDDPDWQLVREGAVSGMRITAKNRRN